MKNGKRGRQPPRFRVGQQVAIRFPGGDFPAVVIEDRGNIGYQGEHILRVRTLDEMEENRESFEIPADSLTELESDVEESR